MTVRSAFALALRRTLAAAWPTTVLAAVAAWVAAAWLDPAPLAAPGDAAARSPWLELVVLVVVVACALTAVRSWPMFAVSAPGRDWLLRLQPTPLRGCGAVLAGAVAAQQLLLFPVILLLPPLFGATMRPLARNAPRTTAAAPLLTADSPRLAFVGLPTAAVAALELSPLAAFPGGAMRASRVQVHIDGAPVGEPMVFEESGQHATLPIAARPIARLELELVGGDVPLLFPPESLWLVEANPRSAAANALIATTACAVPTFVALAMACLCGTVAALPTVWIVTVVLQFLFLVGGVGPAASALQQLLRGRWLVPSDIFAAGGPSVGAGVLAMILAMLLHRRHAR